MQYFFDKNTTLKIEEDGSSATITLFAQDGSIELIGLYANNTITVRALDYLGARVPVLKVIEAFTAYCSEKIQTLPVEWHRAHKAMYSYDHSTAIIRAVLTVDCTDISIEFNALDYFKAKVADGSIGTVMKELEKCCYCRDFAADQVAEYFFDLPDAALQTFSPEKANTINQMKKAVAVGAGYEVRINETDVMRWYLNNPTVD